MQKIWLILQSEFSRRVRSTAFIVATLVVPVFLILMPLAPSLLTYFGSQSGSDVIAVVDETGADLLLRLQRAADDGEDMTFRTASTSDPDSLRQAVLRDSIDAYLVLPQGLFTDDAEATLFSSESGGLSGPLRLNRIVDRAVQDHLLAERNVPDEIQAIMDRSVTVNARTVTESGSTDDNALALSVLGFIMAFSIYFAVFFYGNYVMQGVIEEKSNRVVEVIVSSVKPFELLMGKVLGIGAMGLVQMLVWVALVGAGMAASGTIVALFLDPTELGIGPEASSQAVMEAAGISIPTIPGSLVLWFLLFFLVGYLLYASVFAAIGSAVEQQQDAQNLMYPVFIPLLIPIMFTGYVVESPNAAISVALSLIPFTSPIVMPLRLAVAGVPFWQPALAFVLLIATFVGTIWIASRIYRVGIFMYGKTPSFADLAKWARQG